MALLAKDLIDDAMALAYPHIAEYATSPVALLRQLSSLDERVIDILLATAPQRVSTAGSNLNCSLANNIAGYSLTSARAYVDFQYFDLDSNFIAGIRIVPESAFDNPTQHPAGIVRGSTFYPCDPLGNRWFTAELRDFFRGDGDTIRYRYVADPTRITALSQTLASPDEAEQYFIWNLVLTILLQAGGVPPERQQVVAAQIAEQERVITLMASKRTITQSSAGE